MELFNPPWSSPTRSLTNVGPAFANASVTQTSIAGAANVDLRPAAGIMSVATVAVVTGAAATASIDIKLQDGVNVIILASTAAAATSHQAFMTVNNNPVGVQLGNNDATHAGNYIVAAYSMTI